MYLKTPFYASDAASKPPVASHTELVRQTMQPMLTYVAHRCHDHHLGCQAGGHLQGFAGEPA